MNEPIEPEELTELLDDDLEMWAQGGTRILPKSQLERPKPDSLPPVAYPSMPPPPVVASTTSSTPVWAALIGMATVFFLAAVGGGIFYAVHRATSAAAESVASTSVAPTVTATSEPEPVTLTTTTEPIEIVTPTATGTTQKTPRVAVAAPPPVVRYGAIQTFAAGAGKPVFLDGKQIGTGGSRIKAACGKHAVSVGSGKAKTYDIPCTGTPLTVGTPDGI